MSQIQALDREQPVLPMMPGVPERRTHSYVRHGTTSLFAALDVASGFVIGKCYKRHRAAEFLNFLKEIDAQVPEGLDIHIVMDNYATHKTPKIKAWLARRPHYHVHFTPTSASWINQVERWFAELTRKRLQRRRSVNVREVLNGIFYVLWTGCQWQALPKDLPPKSTVHDYLELWNWDGTLERIHHELYMAVREQEGREPSPTVAIIDSQTAKGSQKGGLRSILRATTRARRSRVANGTSWSTRWASC